MTGWHAVKMIQSMKCICYEKRPKKNGDNGKGLPLTFVMLNKTCSRKNLVFLFGALINLTIRVDAYFHPIRMTNPIPAAPNWGKPAKHFLLLRSF